jgi:hypothetical protein
MGAMREPSDPLIITASPGCTAATTCDSRGGKRLPQRAHERTAAEHEIDAVGEHRHGQFPVQIGAARAELQHVAEHRDAPAERANFGLPEQGEGCAHRGRIGIVTFVDQERRAAGHVEGEAGAASARRPQLCKRQCGERKIGAHQHGRCQDGERIDDQMPPWRAEFIGGVGPENSRLDRGHVGLERALDQFCVGARVLAERDDPLDTGVACAALEPLELWVFAVDHRRAATLDPEEDFRLGIGDRLE